MTAIGSTRLTSTSLLLEHCDTCLTWNAPALTGVIWSWPSWDSSCSIRDTACGSMVKVNVEMTLASTGNLALQSRSWPRVIITVAMSPKEPCAENPWTRCVTCLCDVSLPRRCKSRVFPSSTAVLASADFVSASSLRRRRHALTADSRRSAVASISATAACVRLSRYWSCWSSWLMARSSSVSPALSMATSSASFALASSILFSSFVTSGHWRWSVVAQNKQMDTPCVGQNSLDTSSTWTAQLAGRLATSFSTVSEARFSTLWCLDTDSLLWTSVHDWQSMSPQVRHMDTATLTHTQQPCCLDSRWSASTKAAMANSVGKPSAMSSKLLPFRSLRSTIAHRHRGQLDSGCDFNHETRQWRHKRWPQGRSLGRVKCSWHRVHSMLLASSHATAVAIVTSCVGLWQTETYRCDGTWHYEGIKKKKSQAINSAVSITLPE